MRLLQHALPANGRFGRYKGEWGIIKKDAELLDNSMKGLIEAWHALGTQTLAISDGPDRFVASLPYRSGDVERFSIAVSAFSEEENFPLKAGRFISALINNCKDEKFTIHVGHLPLAPDFLCYENVKEVTVNGDVNSEFGIFNKGRITLNGNAGPELGSMMESGRITVNGSVRSRAAESMKGGTIIVQGDTGRDIMQSATGGTVIVMGNAYERPGTAMKDGLLYIGGSVRSHLGLTMSGGTIVVRGEPGIKIGKWMYGGKIFLGTEPASGALWTPTENDPPPFRSLGSGAVYLKGRMIAGSIRERLGDWARKLTFQYQDPMELVKNALDGKSE